MRKLITKLNEYQGAKRVFALALAFVFAAGLFAEYMYIPNTWAFADEDDESPDVGNTYYYKWHLCTSDEDMMQYLPKGKNTNCDTYKDFSHRVLILYGGDDPNNPEYRISGIHYDNSDDGFDGEAITNADGIDASKSEFITLSNFQAPFIKKAGQDSQGDETYMIRLMSSDSPSSFDSAYEMVSINKKLQKQEDGTYPDDRVQGSMTEKALNNSMLYVYNCYKLWGGVQSADFFPKLVSKFDDDPEDSAWYDGQARTEAFAIKFYGEDTYSKPKENTGCVFIYRKALIDAIWYDSGANIDMGYLTDLSHRKAWFKFYISTLVEKPAICESILYSGYVSVLIDSVMIKPGVTVVVRDGAVLRLSGNVTNLGEIRVYDGGTVIVDEGCTISTEASAVVQDGEILIDGKTETWTAHPGKIWVKDGGQLIALEGSTISLPMTGSFQTINSVTIESGGSFYLAGNFYNASPTYIKGELYIKSGATVHQGYYLNNKTLGESSQSMFIYRGALLVIEPNETTAKDAVIGEACCGVYWTKDKMKEYQKWGGIYYNWGGSNCLHFHPGITQTTIDSSTKDMTTEYNASFKSGDNEYVISEVISYNEDCVDQFFRGRFNEAIEMLNSGTGSDSIYIDPETGKTGNSYNAVGVDDHIDSNADQAVKDKKTAELRACKLSTYLYKSSWAVESEVEVFELDCDGNRKSGGC